MNIIYRELDASEISASLFQTFIRRQVVNLCYRHPDATASDPGKAAGWVVRVNFSSSFGYFSAFYFPF